MHRHHRSLSQQQPAARSAAGPLHTPSSRAPTCVPGHLRVRHPAMGQLPPGASHVCSAAPVQRQAGVAVGACNHWVHRQAHHRAGGAVWQRPAGDQRHGLGVVVGQGVLVLRAAAAAVCVREGRALWFTGHVVICDVGCTMHCISAVFRVGVAEADALSNVLGMPTIPTCPAHHPRPHSATQKQSAPVNLPINHYSTSHRSSHAPSAAAAPASRAG
jgi:hypothetical protein